MCACLCACVCGVCICICVNIREQLTGVNSLLLPCGSRDSPLVFRLGVNTLSQLPFTPISICFCLCEVPPSLTASPSHVPSAPFLWAVASPCFSGHVLSASCFPWKGLRWIALRIYPPPQGGSLKSALGAQLNLPSLAPPTTPQVLSLHPNSYRNLNCSQLKTQERNVSTLVQSTQALGSGSALSSPHPTPP